MSFLSCGDNDIEYNGDQKDQLLEFLKESEYWNNKLAEIDLIPYSAFAAETSTSFTPDNSTEESRLFIHSFTDDLEMIDGREAHNWVIDYGSLLREIIVDNGISDEEKFFTRITLELLPELLGQKNLIDCIIESHTILQHHALLKANSYNVRKLSVNGDLFDLDNFMTINGLGSGLFRIYSFLVKRKKCSN